MQRGFSLIFTLICILFLAILIIAAYHFFHSSQTQTTNITSVKKMAQKNIASVFVTPSPSEINSWSEYTMNNKLTFKYPKDLITIKDRDDGYFALFHRDYPSIPGFGHSLGFSTEPTGIFKSYDETYQKSKEDPGDYELKTFQSGYLMKQDIGYPLDGKRHYYMMYVYWKSPDGGAIMAFFKDYTDEGKIFEKILSTVKILK